MAFFLVTAMKTANLTKYFNFIMHYIWTQNKLHVS
jgi:hypothetical protein